MGPLLRLLFWPLVPILPAVALSSSSEYYSEKHLEPYQSLSASLGHTFPESTHHHPAYSSVIVLIDSLATAPSCHRTATTDFIADCNHLGANSPQNAMELKMHYAVRLAVCEFEASGIQFPAECSQASGGRSVRPATEKKRVQSCLKKLETRPQWWTTLSNNLQNAIVICAAVKNEVEEDRLLDLYRNVTKVQESLFEAMDTSLQGVWHQLHEQQEWAAGWKGMMAKVHGDVETAGRDASHVVRTVGKELAGLLLKLMADSSDARKRETSELEEIEQTVHRIRVTTEELAQNVDKSAIETQDTLASLVEKGRTELHSVVEMGRAESMQLQNGLSTALGSLHQKISDIVMDLDAASVTAKELGTFGETLSSSYVDLSAAQDAIWKSLREQQAAQYQLHSAFEATMDRMLASADRFEKYIDLAEERSQNVGPRKQLWIGCSIIVVGLGVIWGADLGKLLVGSFAILAGVMMLLRSPEVLQAFALAKNVFQMGEETNNLTSARTYRLLSPHIIDLQESYWRHKNTGLIIIPIVLTGVGVGIYRRYSRRRRVQGTMMENVEDVSEKTTHLPTHN